MSLFSSKSQNQIEKLTEENDELKNTLHTVLQKHTSHMELENKIEESKKELARLAEIQKDVEGNIQNLNMDKIEKEQELDSLLNEIKDLQSRKDSLISEIDSIKIEPVLEEIRNLEARIDELKEEEQNINGIITKLKTEEAKKAVSLKNIDERLSLSDEVKTNLDSSLNTIIALINEREKEYDELVSKIGSISSQLTVKQKEYEEFDQRYSVESDKLTKIEDEIQSYEEKKTKLLGEVRNAEIIKNQINEEMLKAKDKEEEYGQLLKEIKNQINDAEKRKLEVEENHLQVENSFSQTLGKFTDELNDAKSKLNLIKQDIHAKEKLLNEKEKVLLEKSFQIAEYGGLNKTLQKERSATEQNITDMKNEHKELLAIIADLKDKETEQYKILHTLRSDTEQIRNKKEDLEKKFREFLDQVNSSYAETEKTADKLKVEVEGKTTQLDELTKRIETAKDELRDLKEEYSKVNALKEEYTNKVSDLISQEKNLKNKISDYEQKMNRDNEPADN